MQLFEDPFTYQFFVFQSPFPGHFFQRIDLVLFEMDSNVFFPYKNRFSDFFEQFIEIRHIMRIPKMGRFAYRIRLGQLPLTTLWV